LDKGCVYRGAEEGHDGPAKGAGFWLRSSWSFQISVKLNIAASPPAFAFTQLHVSGAME
jgi:hypothetical protein